MRRVFTLLLILALFSCREQAVEIKKNKENSTKSSELKGISNLQGDVTFTLEDAEAIHREYPDTFWIPKLKRRESLVKNGLVKLLFNLSDGKNSQVERMWVIVKNKTNDVYVGILDNDPFCTKEIKSGMEVSFKAKHVIDIFEEEKPHNEK